VSVLTPVRSLESFDLETLLSGFELSYTDYELIFCCADSRDDAVVGVAVAPSANRFD
jgi:hypothetical protein